VATQDLIQNGVRAAPADLRWSARFRLCKPRVLSLIVFTALVGMFLAPAGPPPIFLVLCAGVGIALVAAAGATVNCMLERRIDAKMARTQNRPLPTGAIAPAQALAFALLLCVTGLSLLYAEVNPLTMWLTLATFLGYAVIYTVLLKPRTPQNIVIGGLAGAMPPVLGWSAVTGDVAWNAWVLLLIIFLWTPPHFWALALYRRQEYAKAGVPMLPVTHGERHTCLQVLIYTVLLSGASLLPFVDGMSSWLYLACVLALDVMFLRYAVGLYRRYSHRLAVRSFRYSIWYLALLFAALLVDHYAVARH
jgi:protoheme IX farnesyltransferase